MSMIKRAKTGKIEEMVDKNTKTASSKKDEIGLEWPDAQIKDILEVPVNLQTSFDVNLDEDDGDDIAVRV